MQAGGRSHRAVDVGDRPALTADDVVVVVADPRLVAGYRSGGLDAAEEPRIRERPQHVVDRLVRDGAEVPTGCPYERLGVGVWPLVYGDQHRDAGARDTQRGRAQQALGAGDGGHGPTLRHFLELFKSWRVQDPFVLDSSLRLVCAPATLR